MRADELEELTITDRGIMARSDDQTIAFGAGLPVHELKRIHAELVTRLGRVRALDVFYQVFLSPVVLFHVHEIVDMVATFQQDVAPLGRVADLAQHSERRSQLGSPKIYTCRLEPQAD